MRICGDEIRFWLPVAVLAILVGYITHKLACCHVAPSVEPPRYKFTRPVPALRGNIFSSYGEQYPFVRSVPYWEYRLDPVALAVGPKSKRRTKEDVIHTIADAIGLDYSKVLKMSENTANRYQRLGMSADRDVYRTLADSSQVAGVVIEDRQVRQYLQGKRLCHVLGSVNAEFVGSSGLEQKFQRELVGVPGTITGMKDAHGRELYDKRITSINPVPGADVFLTVDPNVQADAEKWLKWGVGEFGAGSGWCIVMDAHTGAVLAMASLPDFDPVAFGRASDAAKVNRAVAFTYEPGSVMKVITAAAAIDCGFATAEKRYSSRRDDPNYPRLPGDSHAMDPVMTVREGIVHSSNVVIGKLGFDLGAERLWRYMKAFGFGALTGIELPGEEYGILRDWRKWDQLTKSRAPIGQGVSVTAIQLASAYQAIANDGLRMRPYIVDKVVAADGEVLYRHSPEPAGRPISAKTARTMRLVMRDVASPKGTARRAAIRGYSIAGKTGTAQKVENGRYAPGLYRATFCGIVPASDPRVVILVTLDFDRHTTYHQGGNSAGPVFRRLGKSVLKYLMIPPDMPEDVPDVEDDE